MIYSNKITGNLNRDNVGLIGKFRPIQASSLAHNDFLVATTHILYNPRAGEVKLAQMSYLLAEMHKMATIQSDTSTIQTCSSSGDLIPCILCGDFNSLPNSPFLRFLLEGHLDLTDLSASSVAGYKHSKGKNRQIPLPILPRDMGIGLSCTYNQFHTNIEESTPVLDSNQHVNETNVSISNTSDCSNIELSSSIEVIDLTLDDDCPQSHTILSETRKTKSSCVLVSNSQPKCYSGINIADFPSLLNNITSTNSSYHSDTTLESEAPNSKRLKITSQLNTSQTSWVTSNGVSSNPSQYLLRHPFNFVSCYPIPRVGSAPPTVTTYHRHASETVDYILCTTKQDKGSRGFVVLSRQALPSFHTLSKLGPQPNDVLSSDHLYLYTELQLIG